MSEAAGTQGPGQGSGEEAGVTSSTPTPKPTLKPIPPAASTRSETGRFEPKRPKLPGVNGVKGYPRTMDVFNEGDAQTQREAQSRRDRGSQRAPKFQPPVLPPSPDGSPETPAQAQAEGVPETPEGAKEEAGGQEAQAESTEQAPSYDGPVVFDGKPFKTLKEAEHYFKSFHGKIKQLAPLREHAVEATKRAHSWKAEADRLNGELQSLKQGTPPTSQTQAPGTTHQPQPTAQGRKSLTESVDWEVYKEISSKYSPDHALQYLLKQIDEASEARLQEALQSTLRDKVDPIHKLHDDWTIVQQASQLWRGARESEMYPELADESAHEHVLECWRDLGLPPHVAMSPRGVHLAILDYRDRLARYQASNPNPSPTASQTPVRPQLVPQQATMHPIAPGAPPAIRMNQPQSVGQREIAEISASMSQRGYNQDGVKLGFPARRR